MTRPRIGIVGVGNMGLGMALNLMDKGYSVAVHDIEASRAALAANAGAHIAPSPAALSAQCELLIIAVVNAQQTERVLFAAQGVIHATPKPRCVMLCPTIAPEDVEGFAAQLASQGIACIDAPMSGGPARARDGSMSLMVACDDTIYERHKMLLKDLSSHLFRISARVGDGARTKLVNNLLASINLAGAAECLALAEKMGLDMTTTLNVIEQSSGQSWIGVERMRRALAGDTQVRAHMSLLAKDCALALGSASKVAFDARLGTLAACIFREACEAGLSDVDDATLLRHISAR